MSDQRQPSGSLPMNVTDPSGAAIYQTPPQLAPAAPRMDQTPWGGETPPPVVIPPQSAPASPAATRMDQTPWGGQTPPPVVIPPQSASPAQNTATPADAFRQFWAPYAQRAGEALGISPNLLLAQWAHESNAGQHTHGYNIAGITAGHGAPEWGGGYAFHKSPDEFVNTYIDLIRRNYPNAIGAGDNVGQFVSSLVSGRIGSYFTDRPSGAPSQQAINNYLGGLNRYVSQYSG